MRKSASFCRVGRCGWIGRVGESVGGDGNERLTRMKTVVSQLTLYSLEDRGSVAASLEDACHDLRSLRNGVLIY